MSASHGRGEPGSGSLSVGIDFDNTIAGYDELMLDAAVGWGLLASGSVAGKRGIRDHLRRLPDGESHWRRLQTYAYGEGMARARPMAGVLPFLAFCRDRRIPVWVVSHKTEYNNFGEPTVNLRRAALDWMAQQGFFDEDATGLNRERVFFEATREEKVARIGRLAPTHFIDDLDETFLERDFPPGVGKIHFLPHGDPSAVAGALPAASWMAILTHFQGLVAADTERRS